MHLQRCVQFNALFKTGSVSDFADTAQFTCFTSTKVQRLTHPTAAVQCAVQDGERLGLRGRERGEEGARELGLYQRAPGASGLYLRLGFTCFTSSKVQIH
jgi:hypothetical protein